MGRSWAEIVLYILMAAATADTDSCLTDAEKPELKKRVRSVLGGCVRGVMRRCMKGCVRKCVGQYIEGWE